MDDDDVNQIEDSLDQARQWLRHGFTDDAIAAALIAIGERLERIDDAVRNTVGAGS